MSPQPERLLVQLASYNTNAQSIREVSSSTYTNDLYSWLAPTLQVSKFLASASQAPDIIAVGFQELLPLPLALSGFHSKVMKTTNEHMLNQIEASQKEKYTLVGQCVNGGVALLVYARDAGIARSICDVQTQWIGCGGPGYMWYMGNKGAVGIRFRVPALDGGPGETYTFVGAHLTPHEPHLKQRIADYKHVVSSLLFPPVHGSSSKSPSTLYETSHLFFLGDFNFRVTLPKSHALAGKENRAEYNAALSHDDSRNEIKDHDQLLVEWKKGTVFTGLREGQFWKFKPSYKYEIGEVDTFSSKRTPSWTDRVLYTTYSDSPQTLDVSNITNVLYTSVPSYTYSDHKPIVCLLLLPPTSTTPSTSVPLLQLAPGFHPVASPHANLHRVVGRILDRVFGITWWILSLLGAGNPLFGVFSFIASLGVLGWLGRSPPSAVQLV